MTKKDQFDKILPKTHMLILGSSGSGKSVVLNGIMTSLLFTDCQLVCIDLKKVELSRYRDSKKCIKYADNILSAIDTLEWVLQETDRRYQVMQKQRIRFSNEKPIYVCIDEVAELLTVDKKRCMPLLQRIGQVSRAANIKMICCSQCLLSTVISTPLRINFDTVIGLRTETKRQSTMIIGMPGLETLPKYGSLVYKNPSLVKPIMYTDVPMLNDYEIDYAIRITNKGATSLEDAKETSRPKEKKSLFKRLFPNMYMD